MGTKLEAMACQERSVVGFSTAKESAMTKSFVFLSVLLLSCGGEAANTAGEVLVPDTVRTDSASTLAKDIGAGIAEACPVLDEANGNHKDLYSHHIRAMDSSDGLSFLKNDTVILDHASVPEAILRPDGEVWVYFISGQPGQHALFIAKQKADGSLETFDCVRIDGVINGNAVDPDIVQMDDGRYRIFFFQGWFVGGRKENVHSFYSASSEDGIHFTLEGKVLEIDGGGTDPTVARFPDGTWLMALAYTDGVLLATSDNGETFTLTGQLLPKGIPELAMFDDGQVRLYIASREGLLIHSSNDQGATWTEEKVVPLGGADPSLIRLGPSSWRLFYKGFNNPPNPN
jgi:hypothetical protein